ncbi:MAG: acetyl-CoA carboxylase biotin carboxyl carrier protein [Crocinitomicaceae bacterium]|nr:acetyl-CoA carboxylase biotin carboxyl carrier protein [Flavobacteriales bacterium]NQZ35740.1 acetyl-CoA carboxylase biotin carboxyl carrier protein [Crocinitomicaceae bacterium]
MNIKEIQDLIKFVSRQNVTEVEIEQKDFKITIKSEEKKSEAQQILVQAPVQAMPQAIAAPIPAAAPVAPVAPPVDEESKYVTVLSPMIGTFYRSAGPDKDQFVSVGDTIKPGDVVCIIEAMKLFNEIEAEISGRIVKVLVDDSTPVEYDQPLFLVDPS